MKPFLGADEIFFEEASTMSGQIYLDENDNSKRDSGENYIKGHAIKVEKTEEYIFSNDTGIYTEYLDTGNYKLSYFDRKLKGIIIKKINPINRSFIVPNTHTKFSNLDFGVVLDTSIKYSDLSIQNTFLPSRRLFRKDKENFIIISAANDGIQKENPVIIIKSIENLNIDSSSIKGAIKGDSLVIKPGILKPYGKLEILVYVSVKSSANLHDYAAIKTYIFPLVSDSFKSDNKDSLRLIIGNSYDPNDKEVSDTQRALTDMKPLNNTVRFQNTGNDTAYDVVVKDKLDASLNPESFSMITTSHPCKYKIVNHELVVTFSNINLPDSHANEPKSHGLFKYQITPYNISNGTKINNTAAIYFDYNFPIITNTVSTLFGTVGIEESVLSSNNNIHLYPNPTTSTTTLEVSNLPQTNTTITLTDILGRQLMLLQQTPNAEGKLIKEIDVSALPKRMYFISVQNEKMRVVSKLVVR